MQRSVTSTAEHRRRLTAGILLLAASVLTSGFSSCSGTVGPLFGPLVITPTEVLLRASASVRQEAVALARVDGGEASDRYQATVEYPRTPPADWLTVEVAGRDLTLRARPDGLAPGIYAATVIVRASGSGASGDLQVEFTVIP